MNHPIRYAYLLAVVPLQLSAQTAEQTEHVDLPTVNVTGQSRTASRDSYTVPVMSTATGLPISPKDTPQSVSVITRKQMDDSGATTLEAEYLQTGFPNPLSIQRLRHRADQRRRCQFDCLHHVRQQSARYQTADRYRTLRPHRSRARCDRYA